jgi:hypothetical protein
MSKKEKLIKKLLNKPTDFTFDDLIVIFRGLGFELDNRGKTSGSAVCFINTDDKTFQMHKPHPKNILKPYQIEKVVKFLKRCGII